MDFTKKRNSDFFNKDLLLKTGGIIILLIIVFLVFKDIEIYQRKKQLNGKITSLQKQIEDLKQSSQNLKNEIANSNSTDYLEKLGYEQFNKTKPGEKELIFIIPQDNNQNVRTPKNFWDVFTGWFSGAVGWIKNKF